MKSYKYSEWEDRFTVLDEVIKKLKQDIQNCERKRELYRIIAIKEKEIDMENASFAEMMIDFEQMKQEYNTELLKHVKRIKATFKNYVNDKYKENE